MRNTFLTSAATLGLLAGALAAPASAQSSAAQSPPSPGASSQMPQPANSMPAGAANTTSATPGSGLGSTGTPAMRAAPAMGHGGMKPMHHAMPARSRQAVPAQTAPSGMDEAAAPPTSAYRGGVGSPLSTKAANLAPGRAEAMGSRLPDPNAAGNSPRELLAAAQRALGQGKTGAAQEALERAETRVLSRTTDPALATQPDQASMVQNIAAARRALGARDVNGAKAAIAMAMDDRMPPRGPATTTSPAGVPSGGTF